jgi:hypothetical protein
MPKEWFTQIVVKMASSPPLNRRRVVGLSDPRSARAQANDAEAQRLAMRQIVHQDNVGLDIPSSESDDEFNLDSPSQSPPRQNRAAEQGAAANAVAPIQRPTAPRNRYFWAGNNAKLNMLASAYINQPMRQEIGANASGSAESIEAIRQLKRDTTQELDFDNLKHSGKMFLIQKTCEQLNDCDEFKALMPEGTSLGIELARQKIKEFSDIAVATQEDQIDIRN